MEDSLVTVRALLFSLVVGLLIIWGWRVLNWVWLKPKKLEKCLRQQGYSGNSYRFLFGEIKEILTMTRQARSKPKSSITDDIAPYVIPHYHQTVKTYGKNSIQWFGPSPRITITDPELIREIFTKYEFQKPRVNPLLRLLFSGLLTLEGDEWAKHRKIISHAFHQDKLKSMLPAFYECCTEMIDEWEKMVSVDGSTFGSSYEEGNRIFLLLDEQTILLTQVVQSLYIPGWRKLKVMEKEIKDSLRELVKKREAAVKAGEVINDDLLGILVESNFKEIQEHGDHKNMGMSFEDVVDECKLFYLAGQETTSVLLVWTMFLLARYPNWQTKEREEVLQVFGDDQIPFKFVATDSDCCSITVNSDLNSLLAKLSRQVCSQEVELLSISRIFLPHV
ncbi:hypothetical protein F3Y22_tig00110596pilonHSYRG00076 [Hibiscus syriacus]|uniref:Uncharacterized protein n=1 Tax=Hibiscus syriacus TaxID=106335 RepID=A0A6A3A5I5_HIBSY|nr:hypothetical protein F3Y22_tig00110596pilonHSYRG00076 [Hibiscus syriacus]